jgi:dienelactone hydrolase
MRPTLMERSMTRRARLSALLFPLLAAVLCGASAVRAQGAFRIEVHPIVSLDADTARALQGKFEGTARTIAGELRLPFTDQQRVPAVVFLHGDAGAVSNQPLWIDKLVAMGIAVFTVDSFSGRGVMAQGPSILIEARTPSPLIRVADAQAALALLAKHPRIDPQRIALMGVSSGARATLYAATKRFAGDGAGGRYAAFVALYPPCNLRLDGETEVTGPIRIHHGAADIVTRPEFCRAYVERLKQAGRDAEFFEYAEGRHGFDSDPRMPITRNTTLPNPGKCEMVERGAGLVNAATSEPLRATDACVSTGIEGGPTPAAGAQVQARVLAYFKTLFAL